jgi:hypothetical protein
MRLKERECNLFIVTKYLHKINLRSGVYMLQLLT